MLIPGVLVIKTQDELDHGCAPEDHRDLSRGGVWGGSVSGMWVGDHFQKGMTTVGHFSPSY